MPIGLLSLLLLAFCAGCPGSSEDYLVKSKTALAEKRSEKATELAEKAYEAEPENRDVRLTYARALREMADATESRGELEASLDYRLRAAAIEPRRKERAADLNQAALLARDISKTGAALEAYEASIEADPTQIETRRAAAHLHDETGNTQPAIRHYLWLWEADRSDQAMGIRLGFLYLAEERLSDAEAVFKRILNASPTNVQAALGRIEALEKMGKPRAVDHAWHDLVDSHEDNPGILFRYADYLDRAGKKSAAERWRKRAEDILPGVKRRKMRRLR